MAASKTPEDEAIEYVETIINTVREPLIVLDQDLRVISASRSFYEVFKIKPEETLGRLIYDLGNKQWDIPELQQLLETLLPQKTTLDDYEVENEFADIGRRTILLNAREIQRKSGKERLILLAIEDITERKRAEQQLQESEEKAGGKERHYRLLFEQSPLGVFHTDKNGVIVSCNDNFIKIIGSSLKALVSLDMNTLPDQKIVMELRKALAGSHGYYEDVYHSVTTNKSTPVRVYFSPLSTDDGTVVGCTGIVEDITEQTQSEQALRRSENYYRSIFETSGSAMFILEEDTTISHVNSNFEKLLGYAKEEVEGKKSWAEFIHADDVDWIKKNHYLRRRDPRAAPLEYEFRFFVRNGELRHAFLTVDLIPDTAQSVVSLIDITERKQAEEALRRERNLKQRYLDTTQTTMVALDAEGRITMINRSGCELLGYAKDEILGCNWFEICLPQPEGMDSVYPVFQRIMAGDLASTEYFENSVVCRDGTQRLMGWHNAFLEDDDGRVVGTLSSGEDITERKKVEEALHQSENYYRVIFETSGTAMFIIEADTTIPLVNFNFEKLSGYSKQEVEGKKSWTEFIHPDDLAWMKKNHYLRRQHPDGAPRQYEFRFINRHGKSRNLLLAVNMIPGTNRSIASCIDITEQKQAEEALKEQSHTLNERNKELSCLYGISRLVEKKDNSIDDILQGTVNLLPDSLQYPEAACARIKFEDRVYVTGNFREASWRLAQDIISEKEVLGCVEIFYLEEKPPAHEGPFIKEEKELIDAVAERLGHIIGHVHAQTRLRQSEQKFRDIFHGSNDAVFIHDISGRFLEVNQVACSRLGYSREELLRMTPMDLDADEYAGSGPQRIQDIDQQGSLVFESVHRCKDGSTIAAEISSRKIDYEGKSCILSIARDLTERKKAEQEREKLQSKLRQSQKMEAIGTLAGGVAHDFNNILSSVLGYTELSMEEVEKGSLVHQNLSQVLTAGNRAKDLVKQILRLSRREEEEFVPTPIVPLVKETLKMLRSTFPATIDIQENIRTEQAIVHADPTQLHQAIINLATNARDAMGDGSGVLEVCLEPVSFDQTIREKSPDIMPGDYICIAISDTGCGISDQYLNKIFEPYFTTKEKGTGTGLGLSMVHGIVKSHKGHISVHSEPGKGTAFHVYLPLAEQSRPVSPVRKEEPLPTGTEKILLVDDEQPIVEIQQRILERLGYEVTPRTSSIEALEAFRANPDKFDVLITDMTMPNMTGDRLAREVKQIRPGLPVVLSTGFSEKIDKHNKEDLRVDGFLMKPVTKTDLAKMVRKVLDKSGND